MSDTCIRCNEPGTRRRLNTDYVDEEKNWSVLCDPCLDDVESYWEERLADYYNDIAQSLGEVGVRWSHQITPIDEEWI
jgi:hypothetical protein